MTDQTTRVVHINDRIEGSVYIGRSVRWRRDLTGSEWANPFGVKRHTREGAIYLYRKDLLEGEGQPLLAELPEIRNRPLACWCRHDGEERTPANECHGDVLVDLLTSYTDDELRALAVQHDYLLLDIEPRDPAPRCPHCAALDDAYTTEVAVLQDQLARLKLMCTAIVDLIERRALVINDINPGTKDALRRWWDASAQVKAHGDLTDAAPERTEVSL